ncbi:MAG TPA: chemotaxis protein CheB [Bacillota bacterium]|nr:chemotaxis protein CheB [Bacillota bacterium]
MEHDVIVLGASYGGVQALPQLIGGLPAELPAAVLVVLHTAPNGPGLLPELIRKVSALPVRHGMDGEKILRKRVYVAPPDHHLMVDADRIRLVRGPKENRHRPAVDALFRTAAQSLGPRVIGVVLTGYLDDGTAGLNSVKIHGGITVVQDPKDAAAGGMPQSALRNVEVDHCVPLGEMAALLVRLAKQRATPRKTKGGTKMGQRSLTPKAMEKQFGRPTGFVCPECNGPLWETDSGRSLQFRCHVGHAYSPDSLLADHADNLERALWSAVRTFDEQAALLRRLAERQVQPLTIGPNLEFRAREHERNAQLIRDLLQGKR